MPRGASCSPEEEGGGNWIDPPNQNHFLKQGKGGRGCSGRVGLKSVWEEPEPKWVGPPFPEWVLVSFFKKKLLKIFKLVKDKDEKRQRRKKRSAKKAVYR